MRARWIALGAVGFLAFAAALFPASVAYRWFAPDRIRLSGLQGTVWSGRAALGSAAALGFHDIRWQAQIRSFLLARPRFRIETGFGDGFIHADVRFTAGEIALTQIRSSCSLSAFAAALPIDGIRGQLSVVLGELILRDSWPATIAGELRLGQLTVPSLVDGEPIYLGNYNVTLSGTNGLRGSFVDQGGPLQVRGTAELGLGGQYEIRGLVQARPEADALLRGGVELLTGEPDDAGMRAFSFTGTL